MSEAALIRTLPTRHNGYPQAPGDRLPPLGWPAILMGRRRVRDARALAKAALSLVRGEPTPRVRTDSAACLADAFRALGLSPDDRQSTETMEAAAAIAGGALVDIGGRALRRNAAWTAALALARYDPGLHLCTATEDEVEEASDTLTAAATRLGMALGCVRAGDTVDARRTAYAAPITLVSVEQLAGDYLRDYLNLGSKRSSISLKLDHLRSDKDRARPLLRGLRRVVLAEADTILLDRARQPVMLGTPNREHPPAEVVAECIGLAGHLRPKTDFEGLPTGISITGAGQAHLSRLAHLYPRLSLDTALGARHLRLGVLAVHGLVPGRDYAVTDARIRPLTGPDALSADLVTAAVPFLEAIHDIPPAEETAIAARINFQRLFSRYVTLSGAGVGLVATGREIRRIYAAPAPLRIGRRDKRPYYGLVATDDAMIAAVLGDAVKRAEARGRTLAVVIPDREGAEDASRHLPAGSLLLWPGAACPVPVDKRHHVLLVPPTSDAGLRHLIEGVADQPPAPVTVLIDLRNAPLPNWWRGAVRRFGRHPWGHLGLRAHATFTTWSATRRASRIREELWDYDRRLSDMLAFAGETE